MSGLYRYCGLTIGSDLPLPELPPAHAGLFPDITCVIGAVPRALPDEVRRTATFAHNGREVLWWIEGIGRFLVCADGRRITIDPARGGDADSLRLMLLHPVVGLASVGRRDWTLSAAAVAKDGRVYAFIGPSASGKSTAAALLVQRGYQLVSDGLLRLTLTPDGVCLAHPQAPWLLLWPKCIDHLGLTTEQRTAVRPDLGLQRLAMATVEHPCPLARIGLLREQRGNELEDFVSSRRSGARGFETLLQHAAGHAWFEDLADRRALFQWGVRLTGRIRLDDLDVPWGWEYLETLGDQLAAWCDQAL